MKKQISIILIALVLFVFVIVTVHFDEIFSSDNQTSSDENSSSSVSSLADSSSEDSANIPAENSSSTIDETEVLEDIKIKLQPKSALLGDVLTLTVTNADDKSDITVNADFSSEIQFVYDEDALVHTALMPVSYHVTEGTHVVTVKVEDNTNPDRSLSKTFEVSLDDREWQIQNLYIDSSLDSNDEANAEYVNKIRPMFSVFDNEQYWEGDFIIPVHGVITTEFGAKRYTNGSSDYTRHSGIDISAAKNTDILAGNNGRVIFSGSTALTGKTVIIEHGLGLKTFYYHLESRDVKVGDMVEKGQVIGKVGTTGYSTGDHLHYAMSVMDVHIDPFNNNIIGEAK